MEKDVKIISEAYANAAMEAIQVQYASNLSGVLVSLERVRNILISRRRELQKGTEWFNSHPIMRLFAVHISHLTHIGNDIGLEDYSKITKVCEDLSRKIYVEGY